MADEEGVVGYAAYERASLVDPWKAAWLTEMEEVIR